MKAIERVEREHLKHIPDFSAGDTVRVHVQVVEGDKVRAQVFQGTVLGRRGGGLRETFTVRKISGNISVERMFPIHSPTIVKIERTRIGNVRRAKLTYMRDRKGKSARIAGRDVSGELRAKAAADAQAAADVKAAEASAAAEKAAADTAAQEAPEATAE